MDEAGGTALPPGRWVQALAQDTCLSAPGARERSLPCFGVLENWAFCWSLSWGGLSASVWLCPQLTELFEDPQGRPRGDGEPLTCKVSICGFF